MDALEFLSERKRMCNFFEACKDCPLEKENCDCLSGCTDSEMKMNVSTVEQWSKEHPRKTRQSVFLEHWPNAYMDESGVLFCPRTVDRAHICYCKDKGGIICRREFWGQEVE